VKAGSLGIAAGAFYLFGCGGMAERQRFERDMERAVGASSGTNQLTIRISSLTRFRWDKVFVFPPYTAAGDIDAQIGCSWNSGAKRDIESNDSFELFVFVRDGRVVQHARIRRSLCDWDLAGSNGFRSGEDVFFVRRRTGSLETVVSVRQK